jgi:cation-transporting P-type ATPase E
MVGVRWEWPAGLDEAEVARRRAAGQGNAAALEGSTSLARIVRRNVLTILNATLFSVSVLLLLLGRYLDAAFTAVPVGTNVLAAVFLEVRAKRQLDRLTLIHTPRVTVRRDGRERDVAPAEVVLGDVVRLARGDQAVVDGRVVAGELEIDESVLSGESAPVVRGVGEAVMSGSVVVAGTAAVETTQVGTGTFASRLAAQARRMRDERTPLRRDLDTLILVIGAVTLFVAVLVAVSFVAAGETLLSDEEVRAAAVLVALVPQGLAIMATVTYSLAAVRVSRAGAIVQRLDATESMSRVDVLCLDKTGTLTSPTLLVDRLLPANAAVDPHVLGARVGRAAASMERADRTMSAITAAFPAAARRPVAEVPFSSLRRWSGIGLEGDDAALVFASPDAWAAAGHDDDWAPTASAVRDLTEDGRRVLLVIEVAPGDLSSSTRDLPPGAVLGILALHEEIRADAASTIGELQERSVQIKFVSGDDPHTVAAIARRVGCTVGRLVTGAEVSDTPDAQLGDLVEDVDVFGRIGPEDKARLVGALRERGHNVGMVGDGVNDVLALRRADLGVAMESGSPAARAVAGIVLLGDRFATLPRAITEGQRVVAAMIAVACLLLARTVYMLVLITVATLMGLPFPFTPTTNAVLAMVTVGIPIFLLALWVPPVRAPPSVVATTLGYAVPAGVAVAILVVPLMAAAFVLTDVATARSIVVAATVFAGIALIPIIFPAVRDRPSPVGPGGDLRPAIMAAAMLGLYALIMAVPLARDIYGVVPLPIELLAGLLLVTVVWALLIVLLIRLDVRRWLRRAVGRD